MRGLPRGIGRDSRRWREHVRPACRRRDKEANAPCWICYQPIDYSLPNTHPDAWSPDHIYPVSTHPHLAEDPANIAPSHLNCNKSRGHRGGTSALLGAPSRKW